MGSIIPPDHVTPILIVGGGLEGMLIAIALARLGVHCVLAEQDIESSKWPKSDFINCRTMEILRMMGLSSELRAQEAVVDSQESMDSIFYTGCGIGGDILTRWDLPSVDEWRANIAENNDGTQPAEPGQRCSQVAFEAWLKRKCLSLPSVTFQTGWKHISHEDSRDGVTATFIDDDWEQRVVQSKYLVGADGAESRVRKSAGIKMLGGPSPVALFLVHLRSHELANKLPFGKFYQMFPPFGGFIVDQDTKGMFTAHKALDRVDQDTSKIDPFEWVYETFGGAGEPFRFKIDEIITTSSWRPNFSIAERYISEEGRVFLAGDAAHCIPPNGGYGMNSGVEDALAISWRLAAVVKGYGGPHLLRSYELEQRPIMLQRLAHCSRHMEAHVLRYQLYEENGPEIMMEASKKGAELRNKIAKNLNASGSEFLDRGIELDARYKSPVLFLGGDREPEWDARRYTPSTYPGSRAPHVFLKDGKTSILDRLGKEWSLVAFQNGEGVSRFTDTATKFKVPLTVVELSDEDHARKVWGYDFVLVRADGHVAWRANEVPSDVKAVLQVVTGHRLCERFVKKAVHEDMPELQNLHLGHAEDDYVDLGDERELTIV